jgi:hypothetical protein
MPILQAFNRSPLTDSNRRPPPYQTGGQPLLRRRELIDLEAVLHVAPFRCPTGLGQPIWAVPSPGPVFGNDPGQGGSGAGRMSPDNRRPLRMCRSDGFCRYRAESLRDALGADVVGQRDKLVDGSILVRPVPDGCGRLGRVPVSPVRPYQGPAKLGLSMTSRAGESRGRPAARVEDHETRLADNSPVAPFGLEDERPEPIGSPTADPFIDQGSGLLNG